MTNTQPFQAQYTSTDPIDESIIDERGTDTTFRALAKRYRRESQPRGMRVKKRRRERDE